MQIEFVAKDYDLDEEMREFAQDRLDRLERFLQEPITAHIVLEVEGHHQRQRAELQVLHRHGQLHASEETHDMREAVHLVIEKIEKQARRSLKKFQMNRRRADRQSDGSAVEGPLSPEEPLAVQDV